MSEPLLEATASGLECRAGGFHIDPWQPVPLAIVTHARAGIARGCERYITTNDAIPLLRDFVGSDAKFEGLAYGEKRTFGDAVVSLHPSGRGLGGAQVRIERGETWVVAPGFVRSADPASAPFEVVKADVFVSEAVYALPVFRWPDPRKVTTEVLEWWERDRALGKPSVIFASSPGTAERLLALLSEKTDRPVGIHPALETSVGIHRASNKSLVDTFLVEEKKRRKLAGELVLAPPTDEARAWAKKIPDAERALASGTMRVRAFRRRATVDRGFVLSDHASWPELLETTLATGAKRVLLTHGKTHVLARALREKGLEAHVLETPWPSESGA